MLQKHDTKLSLHTVSALAQLPSPPTHTLTPLLCRRGLPPSTVSTELWSRDVEEVDAYLTIPREPKE